MSSIMSYLFKRLGEKIKTVAPYNHQSLHFYSLYELVFGRKLKLLLDLETNPDIKVVATYKEYYERS